ncbi:hypothetical protein [Microscilla marina]|uniref:Conserved protein n=1 Tax=Microscilla marina ATCC 23134 TaxID=313606 RepID=A1ZLZ7_MICM2|nr:hypothetical protein [Microscilla marina]EAY28529.1 conserved protein [Microscilla marina ATCC 23134]
MLIAIRAQYADDNWRSLPDEANGHAGVACAAFVSVTLHKFGYNVWATVTNGTATEDSWGITLKYQLTKNGYKQSFNTAYLRKDDIRFTIDKWFSYNNGGNYYPMYCYFFLEWVTPGKTNYTWVVNNQGKRH